MSLRSIILALALASAASLSPATAQAAIVVRANQATLSWTAAPGTVVDYGVWIVPSGSSASSAPTFRVPGTTATIPGTFGTTVTVRVAAYYAGDVLGPFSPDSQPIHFRAPAALPYDLDGNGTVDRVFREEQSGELLAFLVDGAVSHSPAVLDRGANPNLHVSGSADFDGDGKADLIAADETTGGAELWLMDGTQVRSRATIASLGAGWYARALGDENLDGTHRLLWRNLTTGETQIWSMNNAQVLAQAPLLPLSPEWRVWATCDLDGDGFRDVTFVDASRNRALAWLLGDGDVADEISVAHPGEGWSLQACGDFENDGREALVWQRNSHLRFWEVASTSDPTVEATLRPGTAPKRVELGQAGDFDGDGDADLLYTRPLDAVALTCTNDASTFTCNALGSFAGTGSWQISSW